MKRSAARSSSSVVTPGRHFERSIFRQRAWIAPAAAICSICSGRLEDDPAAVHVLVPLGLLLHPQRRQQRADPVGDLVGRAGRRRPLQQAAAPRSTRSAARSSRGTARAGCGSPRACRRRGSRAGSPQTSQTPSFSGGSKSTWKMWPLGQVRRPPSRRTTSSSGTSIRSAAVSSRPSSASFSLERLGLRLGAREAVEDEAVLGLVLVDPLGDHADDHLVGDEVAAVHVLLGLAGRSRCRRGPRRAGCRRSRSRGGRGPPAGARPGCPCPDPGGPRRIRFSSDMRREA